MLREDEGAAEIENEVSALGARVRALRQQRRVTLRELAGNAGVSPSLISQFERGQVNVSVGVLRRIAQALGLATADLFDAGTAASHQLVRRRERPRLPTGPGAWKYLVSAAPAKHVEVYTAEIQPGGLTSDEPYAHGSSQEILLVLRGEITCQVGDSSFEMFEGDSVEYQTDVPHRVANTSKEPAEVLWVISPPSIH